MNFYCLVLCETTSDDLRQHPTVWDNHNWQVPGFQLNRSWRVMSQFQTFKQFLKVNLVCVFNFRTFVRQLQYFETIPDEYETTIRTQKWPWWAPAQLRTQLSPSDWQYFGRVSASAAKCWTCLTKVLKHTHTHQINFQKRYKCLELVHYSPRTVELKSRYLPIVVVSRSRVLSQIVGDCLTKYQTIKIHGLKFPKH